MAINVRGSALAVKHAARVMVDKKIRGSIICNVSLEGIVAGAASLAYNIASKHAVVGIVKAAAKLNNKEQYKYEDKKNISQEEQYEITFFLSSVHQIFKCIQYEPLCLYL
uniref:Alcohol dehydrogenase n=1 Tax=Solanum tuberosum TaxID=4113 RepID=M1DRE4_SOLTU